MTNIDKILRLRQKLHLIPEPSGQEIKTSQTVKAFLSENTSLEITEKEGCFIGVHYEGEGLKSIAFRADLDAVSGSCGCFHGCGHDGHTAVLCGLALELEGRTFGKNIYLIFQPSEENGQGAAKCSKIINEKNIERIYGFHNIPGYKEGRLLIRKGVFALSSVGVSVTLTGRQCHAAYPETGINPIYALSELALGVNSVKGTCSVSLVGLSSGDHSFGVCPKKGRLSLTARAENEKDLVAFISAFEAMTNEKAFKYGLKAQTEYFDFFPETKNSSEALNELWDMLKAEFDIHILEEPMRWSEDFGRYLRLCKGVFFGIGCGENHPALHTEEYSFNDRILPTAIKLFLKISETGV